MAYTSRTIIDLSASGQPSSHKTSINPLTPRQTSRLPESSSVGSLSSTSKKRVSPKSRVRAAHRDSLPSSQSPERELLLEHASPGRLLEDCNLGLSRPSAEETMKNSDEELWDGYVPESLEVAEVQQSPEDDLVSEAKALQASLRRHGVPSRAEEKKREDNRDRQALLDIIRSRKKQRRSQSFASDTSSNTLPLVPATSSPPQKRGQPSTPPTSVSGQTASADWLHDMEIGLRNEVAAGRGSLDVLSVIPEGGADTAVQEEEEAIPWSSSPAPEAERDVLVPDSDDGAIPFQQLPQFIDDEDSDRPVTPKKAKAKRKRKSITPDPGPQIVDLVSDDDEHTWEDNDMYNNDYDDYNDYNDINVPHSQLAKLPPAPPIPIWVPDSPEPEEIVDDVVYIHDLPASERDFFLNHFKRAARGQVEGETGHERQARNMAQGIGTAKAAATKKRAASAKKPWGRGGWRGRGRGSGRGKR